MENEKASLRSRLAEREGLLSALASLICIAIGLALGFAVLAVIDAERALGDGLPVILGSCFGSVRGMGKVLVNAAPLIMTGLSVGLAYKTGLYNTGAAGQYTLGAFGALYCAIVLQLPWYLCLTAAMICGAVWGALPGIFKAYLNVSEVISTIMFNWIGLYLVNDMIYGMGQGAMYDMASGRTYSLRDAAAQAVIPGFGMSEIFGEPVTIAIFIAIFFAIVICVLINRTTLGYELKVCGLNRYAAQCAGINDRRSIVLSMTISGALAGVGAGLYYLSAAAQWNPQMATVPAMGFDGIAAALLACSNPIGTIFSSLFISCIAVGGTNLSAQHYAKEIADIVTAILIYLCAFSLLLRKKIRRLLAGRSGMDIGKGGEG